MPPLLAGASFRWVWIILSISVSMAFMLHLFKAAGERAKEEIKHKHFHRVPFKMLNALHRWQEHFVLGVERVMNEPLLKSHTVA